MQWVRRIDSAFVSDKRAENSACVGDLTSARKAYVGVNFDGGCFGILYERISRAFFITVAGNKHAVIVVSEQRSYKHDFFFLIERKSDYFRLQIVPYYEFSRREEVLSYVGSELFFFYSEGFCDDTHHRLVVVSYLLNKFFRNSIVYGVHSVVGEVFHNGFVQSFRLVVSAVTEPVADENQQNFGKVVVPGGEKFA